MCFFFIASLLSETDIQYCSWKNANFYLEPRSRVKKVTLAQIKAFIACILNVGVICKPPITVCWFGSVLGMADYIVPQG
jgi:hypothetical protein